MENKIKLSLLSFLLCIISFGQQRVKTEVEFKRSTSLADSVSIDSLDQIVNKQYVDNNSGSSTPGVNGDILMSDGTGGFNTADDLVSGALFNWDGSYWEIYTPVKDNYVSHDLDGGGTDIWYEDGNNYAEFAMQSNSLWWNMYREYGTTSDTTFEIAIGNNIQAFDAGRSLPYYDMTAAYTEDGGVLKENQGIGGVSIMPLVGTKGSFNPGTKLYWQQGVLASTPATDVTSVNAWVDGLRFFHDGDQAAWFTGDSVYFYVQPKLDISVTPTDDDDLITKGYADANYSGGSAPVNLTDTTLTLGAYDGPGSEAHTAHIFMTSDTASGRIEAELYGNGTQKSTFLVSPYGLSSAAGNSSSSAIVETQGGTTPQFNAEAHSITGSDIYFTIEAESSQRASLQMRPYGNQAERDMFYMENDLFEYYIDLVKVFEINSTNIWSNLEKSGTLADVTLTPSSGSLTDGAPTNSELETVIGVTASAAGDGAMVKVTDSDGAGGSYIAVSNGTAWGVSQITFN